MYINNCKIMPRKNSNNSRRGSKPSIINLEDIAENADARLSFISNVKKPTFAEYQTQSTRNTKLFQKVYSLVENKMRESDSQDSDILVSSFGMRNVSSLENALKNKRQRKLLAAYKTLSEAEEEEGDIKSLSIPPSTSSSRTSAKTSTETDTDLESILSDISGVKRQLDYLLGLDTVEEEHIEKPEAKDIRPLDEFKYSTSASMREAQRYLRFHRIFDFFQFIVAHLLGSQPENPIEFIIKLLNKSLLYRSGLGKPPLLYTRKHINLLFTLMDRMRTGFVDKNQYIQGMQTLGLCEYDENPPVTPDGLIEKNVFVEKVYEAEQALFDDLIKRKWIGQKPTPTIEKPRGDSITLKDMSGPFFIPSDLFRSNTNTSSGDEFHEG